MRVSHAIRRKAYSNMKPAVRLAEQLGTPLNTFITVNFSYTCTTEEGAGSAFSRLRDNYFNPWARRPKKAAGVEPFQPAFLWVFENAGNVLTVHWMAHIPKARLADFKRRLPVWLGKVTGGIHSENGALVIKPVTSAFGLVKYLGKGIDVVYAAFYRLRPEPQGKVHGKRCGFSQNLGPSACRAAGTYHSQIQQARKAARVAEQDNLRTTA